MPLEKQIDTIDEADLQFLLDNGVPEDKTIDYKERLLLDTPPQKDELRRDVTSFANAFGGHIVFGMKESGGTPTELSGFDIDTPEALKQRVSNTLASHIQPFIPGITHNIKPVQLQTGKWALVLRIPQSFVKPHQVLITEGNFKDNFQFWVRDASSKRRLNVDELRLSFTLSATLGERIRAFRMERLGNILAGDTPVPMETGAKAVLHLVPVSAFSTTENYDVSIVTRSDLVRFAWANPNRYNFDGYLFSLDRPSSQYLQVFRNGILEAASAGLINNNEQFIPSQTFEYRLLQSLPELLNMQKVLGANPPVLSMLSLVNVKGYKLAVGGGLTRTTADRDVLVLPDVSVSSFSSNPDTILKPAFDMIWNTFGLDGCAHFNDDEKWIG